MSLRKRYAFTVTATPDRVDQYGDPIVGAQRTIAGCTDWPSTSAEVRQGFVQSRTSRMLSLPPGADPIPSDWIVIYPDGARWRVVGEPYDWHGGPTVEIERRR